MRKMTDEEILEDLQSCLYEELDLEKNADCRTLHRALNYLYTGKKESNESPTDWLEEFKNHIKIERDQELHLTEEDWNSVIQPAKDKWIINGNTLEILYENINNVKQSIIYESPRYELDTSLKYTPEYILDDKCNSQFAKAIISHFKGEDVKSSLIENSTGFFDVIPIPLPLSSSIRKKWAKEENFVLKGKPIFVHFFLWALDDYKEKLNDKLTFAEHKFAIGIPLTNAITLYEYFNTLDGKKDLKEIGFAKMDFCKRNEINNEKEPGLWLPLFKNYIMGSSNTSPDAKLISIAFE